MRSRPPAKGILPLGREWMERDSNPQDPKATGLQPATLPITCYPSVLPPSITPCICGGVIDGGDASGGTRTHSALNLSQRPLPLGYRGEKGQGGIRTHKASPLSICNRAPLPITSLLALGAYP